MKKYYNCYYVGERDLMEQLWAYIKNKFLSIEVKWQDYKVLNMLNLIM